MRRPPQPVRRAGVAGPPDNIHGEASSLTSSSRLSPGFPAAEAGTSPYTYRLRDMQALSNERIAKLATGLVSEGRPCVSSSTPATRPSTFPGRLPNSLRPPSPSPQLRGSFEVDDAGELQDHAAAGPAPFVSWLRAARTDEAGRANKRALLERLTFTMASEEEAAAGLLPLSVAPALRVVTGLERALESAKKQGVKGKILMAAKEKLASVTAEMQACVEDRDRRLEAFRECATIRRALSELILVAGGGECANGPGPPPQVSCRKRHRSYRVVCG